jgi:predicted dehydrogenase
MADTKKRNGISRRGFLGSALAASAFTVVPRHVLGGPGNQAPSETLTKAVVGVGGMGQGHVRYGGAKLLAICDVDDRHLQSTLNKVSDDVKGYHDYREVLARPDIDIVHVVTPPHWHGLIAMEAAEAGKDIWCEKPMTRTIGEGQKVVEAVQRNGSIFRLNTWFRFRSNFYGFGTKVAPIKKLVNSGLLGWPLKVTVNGITGFNWKLSAWTGKVNVAPQKVPQELDYDFWLGPAPYKPYFQHRTHRSFRGYWDYDGGGLGDMGQHYLDPVQYILGKDHTSPVEVEADTRAQHPDAAKPWRWVRLRYADGCEIFLDGENARRDAPYIEGPEGKLYPGFKSDIPNLREKLKSFPDPEPQLEDFFKAVRTRKKFALNEQNGHRSCTLVNLSKIAVRLGRKLRFDPENQLFVDDAEANRLVHQPMRAPWSM